MKVCFGNHFLEDFLLTWVDSSQVAVRKDEDECSVGKPLFKKFLQR